MNCTTSAPLSATMKSLQKLNRQSERSQRGSKSRQKNQRTHKKGHIVVLSAAFLQLLHMQALASPTLHVSSSVRSDFLCNTSDFSVCFIGMFMITVLSNILFITEPHSDFSTLPGYYWIVPMIESLINSWSHLWQIVFAYAINTSPALDTSVTSTRRWRLKPPNTP